MGEKILFIFTEFLPFYFCVKNSIKLTEMKETASVCQMLLWAASFWMAVVVSNHSSRNSLALDESQQWPIKDVL